LDPDLPPTRDGALTVIHQSMRTALEPIKTWLADDLEREARLMEEIGRDLKDPKGLADLLLGAAFAANPGGLVLVASNRPERLRRAAAVAADQNLHADGMLLGRLLREQGCSLAVPQ